MPRIEVQGAAAALSLAADLNDTAMTLTLSGDVTGWPTGAADPFVIVVGGTEKILCDSLSGTGPASVVVSQRGYDGTTAQSHNAGDAVIHAIGAVNFDDLMDHVYNVSRDDHTLYIRKDGTRAFTSLTSIAAAPTSVGTANAQGSATTLPRSDHVHRLGAGSVFEAAIFADRVVESVKIALLAVLTEHIADGNVTNVKLDDDSVDSRVIAAAQVLAEHIADDAVGLQHVNLTADPTVANEPTRKSYVDGRWTDVALETASTAVTDSPSATSTWEIFGAGPEIITVPDPGRKVALWAVLTATVSADAGVGAAIGQVRVGISTDAGVTWSYGNEPQAQVLGTANPRWAGLASQVKVAGTPTGEVRARAEIYQSGGSPGDLNFSDFDLTLLMLPVD